MYLIAFILVCTLVSAESASLESSHFANDLYSDKSNATDLLEKKSRSINLEINDISDDEAFPKHSSTEDPASALNGIYADCFVNLSFPCLQKKVLIFLDRLGRVQKFSLIEDFLSVERIDKDASPSLTESTLSARKFQDENTLKSLIDVYVDRFFDSHVIKLHIPAVLEENGRSTTLDLKIGDNLLNEGRKKGGGGGGGKMKGMKKMMMMMGMMMIMKMSLLGPMMMGLIGMAALKALIFSVISITISKIMILKKLKMMMDSKGGGHGGGGHGGDSGGWSSGGGGGGGGGGWDRSLDSHHLSYNAYAS